MRRQVPPIVVAAPIARAPTPRESRIPLDTHEKLAQSRRSSRRLGSITRIRRHVVPAKLTSPNEEGHVEEVSNDEPALFERLVLPHRRSRLRRLALELGGHEVARVKESKVPRGVDVPDGVVVDYAEGVAHGARSAQGGRGIAQEDEDL